jgi:hypothetical protein
LAVVEQVGQDREMSELHFLVAHCRDQHAMHRLTAAVAVQIAVVLIRQAVLADLGMSLFVIHITTLPLLGRLQVHQLLHIHQMRTLQVSTLSVQQMPMQVQH